MFLNAKRLFYGVNAVILATNITIMAGMRRREVRNIKLFGGLIAGLSLMALLLFQASVLAIARGYTTIDSGLQTGMVVALSADGSTDSGVERATQDSSTRVVGVVTTVENSFVTVGSESSNVLVESEGQVQAYVSDINGGVARGDLLVLSPLKGILMKSSELAATVIGVAGDAPSNPSPYNYTDAGQTKQTQIAKVTLNLNQQGSANAGTESDSALARLGRTIVGKDVGEARVLIALIIFVIVLIAEGAIIYGAISSAMTALGRNPLARKIIRAEMIRVVFIALAVMLVGLAAVYAILWV